MCEQKLYFRVSVIWTGVFSSDHDVTIDGKYVKNTRIFVIEKCP